MDYYLIKNIRGSRVHVAGPHDKPLCNPDTKLTFSPTLLGRDMHLCGTCAKLQLRAMHFDRLS
jgi:hypothetical protein